MGSRGLSRLIGVDQADHTHTHTRTHTGRITTRCMQQKSPVQKTIQEPVAAFHRINWLALTRPAALNTRGVSGCSEYSDCSRTALMYIYKTVTLTRPSDWNFGHVNASRTIVDIMAILFSKSCIRLTHQHNERLNSVREKERKNRYITNKQNREKHDVAKTGKEAQSLLKYLFWLI